jgi:hypothetical protein
LTTANLGPLRNGGGVMSAVRWVGEVRDLVMGPVGARMRPTTVAQLEDASTAWIVRAFEHGHARGVLAAGGYDRRRGWSVADLGATADAIPTLLRFAWGDPFERLRPLAYRAGTALQSYQLAGGALGGAALDDTAAAIDAWCALALDSNDMSWLEPARSAAKALLAGDLLSARAAGAMARLSRLDGDARYARAARGALDSLVSHQQDDAWIEAPMIGSAPSATATTDVVSMCLALLAGADALDEPVYADAAIRAGSGLLGVYQDMRGLPARLVASWQPRGAWSPVADASAATLWLRLGERTASADFRSASGLVIDRLRRSVFIRPSEPGTSGALRAVTDGICSHPMVATVRMLDLVAELRWGNGAASAAAARVRQSLAVTHAPARSQWARSA